MNLDLEQMIAMVDIISEEKDLPKDTVLDVIQQAIAAAWRKDNGEKDMNVRCELDLNSGEAVAYVAREVIEDGVAYDYLSMTENQQVVENLISNFLQKEVSISVQRLEQGADFATSYIDLTRLTTMDVEIEEE